MATVSPANPTLPLTNTRPHLWTLALIITATLAGAVVAVVGVEWPAGVGVGSALVATVWVATTDLRHRIIPNTLTLVLAVIFTVTAVVAMLTSTSTWTDLARAASAVGLMGAIQLGLFILGATSPGDVKLATTLMIPAGLVSWPAVVAVAVLPYFLALPEALVKTLSRRRHVGVAFGPYLTAASVVVLVAVVVGVL